MGRQDTEGDEEGFVEDEDGRGNMIIPLDSNQLDPQPFLFLTLHSHPSFFMFYTTSPILSYKFESL